MSKYPKICSVSCRLGRWYAVNFFPLFPFSVIVIESTTPNLNIDIIIIFRLYVGRGVCCYLFKS